MKLFEVEITRTYRVPVASNSQPEAEDIAEKFLSDIINDEPSVDTYYACTAGQLTRDEYGDTCLVYHAGDGDLPIKEVPE